VTFAGWAFERKCRSERQGLRAAEPDIKVNYTPLDLQLYTRKMVALFNARAVPDASMCATPILAPGGGRMGCSDRRVAEARRV